jgi:hypothetical protein
VKNLLENYPKNSTAFYLMGCIYEKKGGLAQGIEYFHKAIEIDPNNVYALFSRGACYNMLGNYEKAIEDYSLALEKDSNRNGRKTILRNIGKVLGLNNENLLTTNSINFANNNMNLSVNPFDQKSNLDINNSSYFNLNNSKTIENLQIENEMNNYINYHLRDIITGSAGAGITNNILIDKFDLNGNTWKNIAALNKSINNNQNQGYNGISNGNGNNYNSNNFNNDQNYNSNNNNSNLRNTKLNFYNEKNDSNNSRNVNSNNITNNRLKGGKLDTNIFSGFKESARNKQNGENDFISPDDKINENLKFLNNKNNNLNSLLGQNLNPSDIDRLIFSLRNNNLNKANSGIFENLKLMGKESDANNINNSEFLQKNSNENYIYNSNHKLNNKNSNNNYNKAVNNLSKNNKGGNGKSKIANKPLNTYPKNQSGTNLPHEINNNDHILGSVKTSVSVNSKNSVDKRDKSNFKFFKTNKFN